MVVYIPTVTDSIKILPVLIRIIDFIFYFINRPDLLIKVLIHSFKKNIFVEFNICIFDLQYYKNPTQKMSHLVTMVTNSKLNHFL